MRKFDFIKEEFKEEIQKDSGLKDKILSAKVDLSIEYSMPEYVIKLKSENTWTNLGSLGNFSCITGKAKARKSFARFFFEAASLKNGLLHDKFFVRLPENKRDIIYIDTEQSKSNVNFAAQRIIRMANKELPSNYNVYSLREYTYMERCEIIEHIIKENKNLGILFLDGAADLLSENNNEVEGNRVVQLLMTWTSRYNIHIMTVMHQPRSHGGATGHSGSTIEKKAESIISVQKDGNYSVIGSEMLRASADFAPFPFEVTSEYVPVLVGSISETINNISGIYDKDESYEDEEIPF